MATHSNILAWRSPWTVEPGSYVSISVLAFKTEGEAWQALWGHKELDTAKQLNTAQHSKRPLEMILKNKGLPSKDHFVLIDPFLSIFTLIRKKSLILKS